MTQKRSKRISPRKNWGRGGGSVRLGELPFLVIQIIKPVGKRTDTMRKGKVFVRTNGLTINQRIGGPFSAAM